MQPIWMKTQRSWIAWALRPIAFIYGKIHQILRQWKRFHQKDLPVPVIVVGNITLGGTGKTPLLIELSKALTAHGFRVGIVSRGYRGKGSFPQEVTHQSPALVGDEPALMARKTKLPMVVDPNRVRAVKYLCQHHSIDVILSDDGLQHEAMKRIFEIAVVDANAKFGNGWLFPAGPLREPISRLKEVDAIVVNGPGEKAKEMFSHPDLKGLKHRFKMTVFADQFLKLSGEKAEPNFGLSVQVMSGIGNPDRFLLTLGQFFQENYGRVPAFEPHFFEDHHSFSVSDFDFVTPESWVVMTEKDAIKCERLPLPRWLKARLLVLSIGVKIDPSLVEAILAKLR